MSERATALIADDELLLREALARQLAQAWPELAVVAQARNGREAIQSFERERPQICFLDVQMPGLSGVEAARAIGRRAHLVFVTAYDQYAVQAFSHGVLDYLVKPVETARLAETVARLKERLAAAQPAANTEALLQQLAAQLQRSAAPAPLRWLRAQAGSTLRLIAVDEIDYLRSDTKYTRVAWRGDAGQPAEALVGTSSEGAARAARSGTVRAGASLGGGQPARDQPRRTRRQRDGGNPPQAPRRGAAGQPQLSASVPPDVAVRAAVAASVGVRGIC